jgi:hypothetical protein
MEFFIPSLGDIASWAAAAIAGSLLTNYLGAGYLKKKGENLATKEDIQDLVAQVSAVTKATKEIEAAVSGDLWDRQKRWELKRDLMLEVATRVSDFTRELGALNACFAANLDEDSLGFIDGFHKRLQSLLKTSYEYDEAVGRLVIVCDKTTALCLEEFRAISNLMSVKISEKDRTAYDLMRGELQQKSAALIRSIRSELGLKMKSVTDSEGGEGLP